MSVPVNVEVTVHVRRSGVLPESVVKESPARPLAAVAALESVNGAPDEIADAA